MCSRRSGPPAECISSPSSGRMCMPCTSALYTNSVSAASNCGACCIKSLEYLVCWAVCLLSALEISHTGSPTASIMYMRDSLGRLGCGTVSVLHGPGWARLLFKNTFAMVKYLARVNTRTAKGGCYEYTETINHRSRAGANRIGRQESPSSWNHQNRISSTQWRSPHKHHSRSKETAHSGTDSSGWRNCGGQVQITLNTLCE